MKVIINYHDGRDSQVEIGVTKVVSSGFKIIISKGNTGIQIPRNKIKSIYIEDVSLENG
jgi:hypothetical protein